MAEHQPVNIHHCKSPILWIWNTSGSEILLIQIPFETRRHVKSPWLLLLILVSLKIGYQKLHWFIILSNFFNNEHATWLGGYTTFSDTPVPHDISSSTSPWFMIFLHDIQLHISCYAICCWGKNMLMGWGYPILMAKSLFVALCTQFVCDTSWLFVTASPTSSHMWKKTTSCSVP